MKTLILASCFLVISLGACAQKTPPAAVTNAFAQKFQNVPKVKWETEEANEWEAEFEMNGKEASASFYLTGKWLETETEIEKKALPAPVKEAIEKQFSGAKTEECSKIETPEFTGYEIALKLNGKGFEVLATNEGKLTVKEESKEKKDQN